MSDESGGAREAASVPSSSLSSLSSSLSSKSSGSSGRSKSRGQNKGDFWKGKVPERTDEQDRKCKNCSSVFSSTSEYYSGYHGTPVSTKVNEAGETIRTSQRKEFNFCGLHTCQLAAKNVISQDFLSRKSGGTQNSGRGGSSKNSENTRSTVLDARVVVNKVAAAATKAANAEFKKLGVSKSLDPKMLIYVDCTDRYRKYFSVKTNITRDKDEIADLTSGVRSFVSTFEDMEDPLRRTGLEAVKNDAVFLCSWWTLIPFNQKPSGLPICLDKRAA
jgi:hypothetical protein